MQSVCTEPTPTPPCTSCDCNPALCPPPPEEPSEPPAQGGDDVCTNCAVCTNAGSQNNIDAAATQAGLRSTFRPRVYCEAGYVCLSSANKRDVVMSDWNKRSCPSGYFHVQRHYIWDCNSRSWHLLSGVDYISSNGTVGCDNSDIDGTCVNNQSPNDALFQAAYQGYTQGTVDGTFYKNGKWYTYDSSTKSFKLKN